MAEDVDDKRLPYFLADALIREKVAHVKEVARMLTIKRCHEFARVKVGEADDLDFREAELLFNDGRDRPGFGVKSANTTSGLDPMTSNGLADRLRDVTRPAGRAHLTC